MKPLILSEAMAHLHAMKHRYDITRVMEALGIQTFAEVGVYEGVFFERLMGVPGITYGLAVDLWDQFPKEWLEDPLIKWDLTAETQKKNREAVEKRWAGDSRVEIIAAPSTVVGATRVAASLDMVYIDAQHNYKDVKEDIAMWWTIVRPGGLLCGHDYLAHKWGVKRAVDEFVEEKNLQRRFHSFRRGGGNWFIVMP